MKKARFSGFFLLFLFLFTSIATTAQTTAETTFHTLQVDEDDRSYHLYVPEQTNGGLVIVLHTVASSGLAMEAITGMNAQADEQGFIVAYPNAAGFYWDDGRGEVGLPPDNGSVDDLGFLTALIDELAANHGVDTESVYLTGYANGGTMAFTAACQQPDQYAGVMIVGALLWEYQTEQCPEEAIGTTDLLLLYGDQDHVYWQLGRTIDNGVQQWNMLGASATHEWWRDYFQCEVTERTEDRLIATHSECQDEATIQFVRMPESGNLWPRMADNSLNRFGVDASELLAAFATDEDITETATPATTATTPEDVPPRNFLLYVPTTYDPGEPTPVIFSLHGRHANAPSQAYTTDFNSVAEREGFIVVYPQGYDRELVDPVWQYGRGVPHYGSLSATVNDEAYLGALIDDLSTMLNIDEERVYVSGLSNGGFMTQRLGCTMPDRFAAFAAVAATAPLGLTQLCDGTPPVPVMLIHGTADTIVPWQGMIEESVLSGQPIYTTAPMDNTIGFWADHNGCSYEFENETLPQLDEDSATQIFSFRECPEDAPLILYAVLGGGHVWPGVRDFESELLGEVSMDFNASEVIWEFFQQHHLDEAN